MDPRWIEGRWLIIADDLTGAADSAIAFAKRRLTATVTWGEPLTERSSGSLAVAFDADTRRLPAEAAARRHREILERLLEPRMHVYKKMDSTLRGHPAEEIGALLDVLAAREPRLRAVFAPAFPAGGRVTRDGRVFVHGTPLERTEFWNPARPANQADLVTLCEGAGLRARRVPLDIVRADPQRLRAFFDAARGGSTVCVCDAEESADLDRIADCALDGTPTLFAGSAGLVHSLARHSSGKRDPCTESPAYGASARGALLIVGSQAAPSRAALVELATVENVRRVSVVAENLLSGVDDGLRIPELTNTLAAGIDVLVDIGPPTDGQRTVQVVDGLARRIAPLVASASALMATGGDTAAAVLIHCGVNGIRLVDELEPGTALGLTLGATSLPVITKSGGFGDAGSLRRVLERLRFIRQTGSLA